MPFEIIDFSTRYSIEVDYDTERNCSSYGCDGMCRCSRLINMEVESVDVSWSDFRFSKKKGFLGRNRLSEINKYSLNRLIAINGGFKKESYEPIAVSGYYGEELGDCYFDNKQRLIQEAQELLDLKSDIEKVFFILKREYSHIAPIIAECTEVELLKVNLSEIQPSAGSLMMKAQNSYLYDFESDEIKGVLFGDNNLLIDGNHRYSYLMTKNGSGSDEEFTYIRLS